MVVQGERCGLLFSRVQDSPVRQAGIASIDTLSRRFVFLVFRTETACVFDITLRCCCEGSFRLGGNF